MGGELFPVSPVTNPSCTAKEPPCRSTLNGEKDITQILADENVPEEYVFALRGDGHRVTYSRNVSQLGPQASGDEITEYAESEGMAIPSTDVKDFGERHATVPIVVAPQDMTGGEVRAAVSHLDTLPIDPAATDPIWLSGL